MPKGMVMGAHPLSLVNVGRCLGDGWCLFVRAAVRGEALLLPGGSLGLGGEDFPDTNEGVITGPQGAEDAARRFAARLRERDLPGTIVALSTCAPEVEAVAAGLGLEPATPSPIMCLRAADARRPEKAYPVERVSDVAGVRAAAVVLADAFGLATEQCEAMLGPGFPELAGADMFLALREGRAVAAAGAARIGSTVGIYAVGTREAHRRRGAGAAAVSAAVDHHVRGGAHLFVLLAATDAEPFYESLGFVVADRPRCWVVERS